MALFFVAGLQHHFFFLSHTTQLLAYFGITTTWLLLLKFAIFLRITPCIRRYRCTPTVRTAALALLDCSGLVSGWWFTISTTCFSPPYRPATYMLRENHLSTINAALLKNPRLTFTGSMIASYIVQSRVCAIFFVDLTACMSLHELVVTLENQRERKRSLHFFQKVIGKAPGRLTRCAATIEFRRDGKVVTSFNGRESVSDFSFRAHAWPRSCTIEVKIDINNIKAGP